MQSFRRFLVPLILMAVGAGWLLSELKIVDLGRLVWTLSLLFSGLAIFAYLGFSRSTFVVAGFLVCASIMSLLRYRGVFTFETEMPTLVIILGVLMAINQTRLVPPDRDPDTKDQGKDPGK